MLLMLQKILTYKWRFLFQIIIFFFAVKEAVVYTVSLLQTEISTFLKELKLLVYYKGSPHNGDILLVSESIWVDLQDIWLCEINGGGAGFQQGTFACKRYGQTKGYSVSGCLSSSYGSTSLSDRIFTDHSWGRNSLSLL